jgi:hypothetical protein
MNDKPGIPIEDHVKSLQRLLIEHVTSDQTEVFVVFFNPAPEGQTANVKAWWDSSLDKAGIAAVLIELADVVANLKDGNRPN